jgi:hypothetical protein
MPQVELLRDRLVRESIEYVDQRIAEFWAQVNKNGPIVDHVGTPCWLWIGQTLCKGYGQFSIAGKQLYCHRISWMLKHGDIPDGLFVCHDCDTPLCLRDDHLFLGTQKENMLDMTSKGRHLYGERNGNTKLSGIQVAELRSLKEVGKTYKYLAHRFGISEAQAHNIVHGKCWRLAA